MKLRELMFSDKVDINNVSYYSHTIILQLLATILVERYKTQITFS